MSSFEWFLIALVLAELSIIFYLRTTAKMLLEDVENLTKENEKIVKHVAPSRRKLTALIRKIMNHKFEFRDGKYTVGSSINAYANTLYELFGVEEDSK